MALAPVRRSARLPHAFVLTALLALLLAAPLRAEEPEEPPEPAAAAPDPAAGADPQPPPQPPLPLVRVPEVTITATRTETDVLDVPGNVTVLTREEIARSGAKDIPDLLRREAGLFVTNTTTNPEGYTVESRGFNNGGGNGSATLVLLNGRRVNEPSSTFADWTFLPLDALDRIEIVRGPVSAAYGDNAMAGVIHLITRHPEEDGVRASVRARAGTYDTHEESVHVEGRDGAVSASAFFDYRSTDAYRDRADFRARDGDLDLRFRLGEHGSVAIQTGYGSNTRLRPGDLMPAQIEEDRRQAEPGTEANFDVSRERWVQTPLELVVNEHLSFRVLPWHRRRTSGSEITDPFSAFVGESETDSLGLDSQMQLEFPVAGRPNTLLVGGDLLQEDVDNTSQFILFDPVFGDTVFPTRVASRRKLWSVFVHDELWVTDELLLSLGVRRDRAHYEATDRLADLDFESRYTAWSPRAALTWRVAEPVSLYVSYSRGFRFPNQDEAFGFFGVQPGLEPQKSDAYETGVKVRSERLTLNLAAYTMSVKDEILFNPEALNPFFLPFEVRGVNVNLDRVRHRGIELFAAVRPWECLELWGSFTYDDVKITRDEATGLEGQRVPITPRYRGNAGVRAFLPLGFEASVWGRFVGSRFVANDLTNALEKLPKFAVYDARLAWRRRVTDHLEIVLDVTAHNLFDREYSEFGGRSAFVPVVGFFPSPERHYVAGVQLTVTP